LIETNTCTLRIILISTIVGSIRGLNQTSIWKILTYSSINHTRWILIALTTNENVWILYFIIYSTLALTVGLYENWSLKSSSINTLKFLNFFLVQSVICHQNCSLNSSPVVICIEIERAEQFQKVTDLYIACSTFNWNNEIKSCLSVLFPLRKFIRPIFWQLVAMEWHSITRMMLCSHR
jgi:hypothetical protein